MASQVTNYQCPACTGPVHFSPESGKVVCDYCGSSYELEEIEALYAEKNKKAAEAMAAEAMKTEEESMTAEEDTQNDAPGGTGFSGDWDTSALNSDWGSDADSLKVYNCPSCNAELICDSSTGAASCPYCGNPTIIPGQFTGALKPNFVIPFKIRKEQAVDALKKHYKGKFLLPSAFTDENHLQEIKGVYVPFWMFDGKADASVTYDATITTVARMKNEEITNTAHYRVRRSGSMSFEKVPVDASSKMSDAYMDSIEPYHYDELKPFSTAYLAGFFADKYDVELEDCRDRADERCVSTIKTSLRQTTLQYQTCIPVKEWFNVSRGSVHYALLPVWILTTKWNGNNYMFAVNGQTGKIVGDLPVSKGKYWAVFAGIASGLSLIGSLAVFLFMM